jgi:hypothetical protein
MHSLPPESATSWCTRGVQLATGATSYFFLFTQAATELSSPLTLLTILNVAAEGAGRTAAQAQAAAAALQLQRQQRLQGGAPSSSDAAAAGGVDRQSPQRRASAEATDLLLLSVASGDVCMTVLRHALLVLVQWLSHAPLAKVAAPRLAAFALHLFGCDAAAGARHSSPLQSAAGVSASTAQPAAVGFSALLASTPVVEAVLGLLAMVAAASPEAATALLQAGIIAALRRLPASAASLLDSKAASESALTIVRRLGASGPDAAIEVMTAGGHGVCQAIAAHWALRGRRRGASQQAEPASPDAPGVYTAAGLLLSELLASTESLRVERALQEARAALGGSLGAGELLLLSEGSGRDSATRRSSSASVASRRDSSASSARGTGIPESLQRIKALLEVERAWLAVRASAEKDAGALARAMSAASPPGTPPVDPSALLDLTVGRMPWSTLPFGILDALLLSPPPLGAPAAAAAALLRLDVWFVPDAPGGEPQPAKPHKARRMALSLSPDFKVLSWRYQSRHHRKELTWSLELSTVGLVHSGLPLSMLTTGGNKRRIFKRSAIASRAIVLEAAVAAGGGALDTAPLAPLLHLEAVNAEQHNTALRVLSLLVQFARARAGVLEPLPFVHVPAKRVLPA